MQGMSSERLGSGLFPVGVTQIELCASIYIKANLYSEQQIEDQLVGYY